MNRSSHAVDLPRRRRFLLGTAAAALAGTAAGVGWNPRASHGEEPQARGEAAFPGTAPFDELMTTFLRENGVPGGALAVSRGGKLVYARGFGVADRRTGRAVEPNTRFRIASVSKPITAVAVLQLVESGKLKLDDPVLDHVPLKPQLPRGVHAVDPRWKKVALRHCLQHSGGWDRDNPQGGFDPIGVPRKIAAALGVETPVPPEDVVRYMLGRPLDFEPGERFAYSNFGYLLLGRAIESASGMKYEAYVKEHVLAPVGAKGMALGRALPEDRFPHEAAYYAAGGGETECLYPPRRGAKVPWPDGGENFEAFEAHGGWTASAPDLLRFAAAFDSAGSPPLLSAESIETMFARPAFPQPAFPPPPPGEDSTAAPMKKRSPNYYGCGWAVYEAGPGRLNAFHTGRIRGTSSLLVRRADGLAWAVLFNTDANPEGVDLFGLIDGPLHRAADAVGKWPEVDLFQDRRPG